MFEKLQVYQKAIDLADEIASLTENFPRGYYFLTDQLNRASLSIAANIKVYANRGDRRARLKEQLGEEPAPARGG